MSETGLLEEKLRKRAKEQWCDAVEKAKRQALSCVHWGILSEMLSLEPREGDRTIEKDGRKIRCASIETMFARLFEAVKKAGEQRAGDVAVEEFIRTVEQTRDQLNELVE